MLGEFEVEVARSIDATDVEITISRVWLAIAATFLTIASLVQGGDLTIVAAVLVVALLKIRLRVSATQPTISRCFLLAGVPLFCRRYDLSQRARLRFKPDQQQVALQLDLVDKVLTIVRSRNDELLNRTAAALYEPMSKWTGQYTIV